MERKYPMKMFWLFVLTNFFLHYFFLSIPGIILCVVGIWKKACLWVGIAVLLLDMILAILRQLQIRKVATTPSDSPEFNELMDAFCSGGLDAFGKTLDEKRKSQNAAEEDKNGLPRA